MREFVYFGRKAWTTGNFKDLMKAGRLDIACHFIIHSFFISNVIRKNVVVNLFFHGPPDPPKHIEIHSNASISKKDVSGLIKRALYKYKPEKRTEVLIGVFVEKTGLFDFLKKKIDEGKTVYLLDKKGENIENVEMKNLNNAIFVFGDFEGIPKKEKKYLSKIAKPISLGKTEYLTSQALTILQYELDKHCVE